MPIRADVVGAIYLLDGYAGENGRGLTGWYRDLTVAEAKRHFHTLYFVDRHGAVRECRSNGAPKVWKTRPGCELPLKYGLKECFRVGGDERLSHEPISCGYQTRIVVPVKANFDKDTPIEVVTDYVAEHEVDR